MAKIIFLCSRKPVQFEDFPARVEILTRRFIPENIHPNPPRILQGKGLRVGILNPTSEMLIHDASVCIGFPIRVPSEWWKPGGENPDGSYGLFRADDQFVEICTDVIATRSIWYCKTDELFLASSSQRAIVAFLGDFQVNPSVFSHMLASGLLGPNHSWDKRINHLEANDHLLLDRQSWEITHTTGDFRKTPGRKSREEYKADLKHALEDDFSSTQFDPEKWVLTLSGGLDSRGILAFLKDRKGLRCATWGTKASLTNPRSDSVVARKVAEMLRVKFDFFETDSQPDLDVDMVLSRYIAASEGRIDNLGAYRDGFHIWKQLFEKGYSGYIRGENFMGLKRPTMTAKRVFSGKNLNFLSDYDNLPPAKDLGLVEQTIPDHFLRRPGESLSDWSDRIRFSYQKVVEFAALNEIKTWYLEVMSPLISRRVIDVINTIPYRMNKGKSIIHDIVNEMIPGVEFVATTDQTNEEILREPAFKAAIQKELQSPEAQKWLSETLIKFILENLSKPEPVKRGPGLMSHLRKIKKIFPEVLILTRFIPLKNYLDDYVLAFRAYIITKSCRMLQEDAALFDRK